MGSEWLGGVVCPGKRRVNLRLGAQACCQLEEVSATCGARRSYLQEGGRGGRNLGARDGDELNVRAATRSKSIWSSVCGQ